MDPDQPSRTRKVRFAPKGPPRRKAKPTAPKVEKDDDNEVEDEAMEANLLRRANEHLAGRGPKVEKKSSSVQVAFGHGADSSSSMRSFGKSREGNGDKSNESGSTASARENREIVISSSPSTATEDGTSGILMNDEDTLSHKIKKDYKEPWDYENTYYPITLPWRRPYSGNPELLDEEEFGGASADMEYDEKDINAAKELGLLEENEEERMIFIHLPSCGNRANPRKENESNMGNTSEGGAAGKMLIYKSGTVKWKIGDKLYDVSAGSDTNFPQNVVAINTVDKECCMLGSINKRAVVTLDIDDFLLNDKTSNEGSTNKLS